jgi:hypothetical protein
MKLKYRFEVRHWLVLAALVRILASFTRVNWHYPDEWYQTIEFTRLLLGKSAIYTHETALHMRNLSWPAALMIPEWVAQTLSPKWTQFRLFCAQLFAGMLDLAAIWAFARLSRTWSGRWRAVGFALLIFPWFRVQDSVSIGAEHIADCLIWLALWALSEKDSKRFGTWAMTSAGLLSVAIFAVKYPAGLVSLGLAIGVLICAARERRAKPLLCYVAGLLLGAAAFGAADWQNYGRPWESLWMYLQYNVLTDAGVTAFGRQSAMQYFDFFQSRWLHALLPFGLAFAFFGSLAVARGLKKWEPWALAFLAYFLGHLAISHREERFMYPAEVLLLWGALKYLTETRREWSPPRWLTVVFAASALINAPLFLKAVFGETGTLNSTYFEVDQRLQENPKTCAVITQHLLSSFLIPGEPSASPVFGVFHAERRRPTFPQAQTATLGWYGDAPICSPDQAVLLHVDRPDVAWVENGCKLQQSGLLELLPQSLWVPFLRRGWVSGPWYACSASILDKFTKQSAERPFMSAFARFSELPPLGMSKEQLGEFRDRYAPRVVCKETCP